MNKHIVEERIAKLEQVRPGQEYRIMQLRAQLKSEEDTLLQLNARIEEARSFLAAFGEPSGEPVDPPPAEVAAE